ncbi:hypothetical protein C8E87_5898 [Paractinoplanes brasiliensis]|uniref:Uncharacterized protein n=1 Tax=Paractinoplanes brasiliensis TaxID=52695 RepID=A0A4R6JZ35_9ACTN|nr:hypothetical protein C8E87_5898 [Actinoplanes brasiliensis]
MLRELGETVAVRWRRDAASAQTHWATKVKYYRAVQGLLAGGVDAAELSWTDVVAAVQPRGSRTTFFSVAGPHAKRPLLGAYRAALARDLAECLTTDGAARMLVDETKVWSYWPHRGGWTDELFQVGGEAVAAECLVRVLLDWAEREPRLASALGHAPPVCAVEDLVVLRRGSMTVASAAALLRAAIRLRLADGHSVDEVLRQLRPAEEAEPGNQPLARAIEQLIRNSHTPSEQRREAVTMMRDAITALESSPE